MDVQLYYVVVAWSYVVVQFGYLLVAWGYVDVQLGYVVVARSYERFDCKFFVFSSFNVKWRFLTIFDPQLTASGVGRRAGRVIPSHRPVATRQSVTNHRQRLNLECGDTSPLSDWETCLPAPKRGHVRALQIKPLPGHRAVVGVRDGFGEVHGFSFVSPKFQTGDAV